MKLLLLPLALCALGVAGELRVLKPVQPLLPVNPRYTFAEWTRVLQDQDLRPEVCVDCVRGNETQPDVAGRSVVPGVPGQSTRIIGGSQASAGQFPWQAQVQMDQSYFCGGSIISQQWILSAGHCADGFSQFVIILGSLYSDGRNDPNRLVLQSRQGTPHENYNSWTISNDISVIKLPTGIPKWNDYIRPVRLPASSDASTNFAGSPAVLSGFGRYGTTSVSNSISPVLNFVNLMIIDNKQCAQTFGSSIRASNICTWGGSRLSDPVGACNGDSGGALVVYESNVAKQVGIVSFGTSLGCNLNYPSAFTRVTSYLNWIGDKTGVSTSSRS